MPTKLACPQCSQSIAGDVSLCPHCGENVSTVLLLETLREETIGEYEILAELGTGGMASVFLAHDLALNRKVALKVMSPALLQGHDTIERFKREAQTAASLSHPHIIPIYAVKQGRSLLYFVMKCVEGRTLGSVIGEVERLPIDMTQAIVGQVGGALGYAHRRGVVHRDIKPDNIMIDSEGWVVVTDFGIAKVREATNLTATGAAIGTPAYMSPEQCSGEPVTGASDQYALGAVAYEMLTGKPPFASPTLMGMMWAHVNTAPQSVTEARPECPTEVAAAVMRMLAKEPAKRFPTVEDAVAAVGVPALAPGDPVRTSLIHLAETGESAELIANIRTPSSPVPFGRAKTDAAGGTTPTRKRPILRWSLEAVVVIVAGVAAWFALRPDPSGSPVDAGPVAATEPISPRVGSIRLVAPEEPIPVGGAAAFSAEAMDVDGNALPGSIIQWESSDLSVATVSPDGVIAGLTPGIAQITAKSGMHSATAVIAVEAPPARPSVERAVPPRVVSVEVLPPRRRLLIGETIRLFAAARAADGSSISGARPQWSSRDPSVASVSAGGVVTGVSQGTTEINGTIDGQSGLSVVTVQPVPVDQIAVSGPTGPLRAGSTVRFTATALDSDGHAVTGHDITWASSNSQVAVVSSDGTVTAVAAGQAALKVSSGGRSESRVVTVVPALETPPEPVFDAGSEIEASIRAYAAALQARDIDRVKQVYPDLPAARERAWRDIFGLGELTVRVEGIQVLEQTQERARARFRQTIAGRRLEQNTTSFEAELVRMSDGWRIVSIR